MKGHVVIISAPSGSGKGTIINHLLTRDLNLEFSISATSRPLRGEEVHGEEYYFMSEAEFRAKIANDEFLEYEEVYEGRFYGTLKSEIDRIIDSGKNVVIDVDVVGGCRLIDYFGDKALSIFVKAPSSEVLRERLVKRGTETKEQIESRIARVEYELGYADKYDIILINDDLDAAFADAERMVRDFVEK